jgi:hypothetical protein
MTNYFVNGLSFFVFAKIVSLLILLKNTLLISCEKFLTGY